MADNVGYTPGSGATVAADDIAGVLHQRVKVVLGADGVNAGDISTVNPMPITAPSGVAISGTANVAVTNTPAVTVSGTPNVAVTNTPSVTVNGTPNVAVTNTPNVTVSNTSVPVAPATGAVFDINAVGELIECLEAMRQYQVSLNRTIGMLMPDTSGRLRILLDAISANLTLGTITTVTSVATLTQLGSQPAQEVVYGALHVGADSIRRNITVA